MTEKDPSQDPASLPAKSVVQRIIQRIEYEEAFKGPIPPPEMLEDYNKVFPGCAERIVAMAEEQGRHRRQTETTMVNGAIANEARGANYGLIIVIVALVGSFILIGMGKTNPGLTVFFGSLASIIGLFIYGRWVRKPPANGDDEQGDAENQGQPGPLAKPN